MQKAYPANLVVAAMLALSFSVCAAEVVTKNVLLDGKKKLQKIDGFGVNITPAQWRDGNLKPVIDMLIDDLGCTLFRFDCFGQADWLDPKKRLPDGAYPDDYLRQVYTGKVFKDAWATFRYLNSKGIEPFFNVSGRIPRELAGKNPEELVDFNGYGEMVVSMVRWAREKENLKFSLLAPFNETDLGFPEGPKLPPGSGPAAIKAIIEKMDRAGLGDVKLIVLGDSNPNLQKLAAVLKDSSMVGRIGHFSTHLYGNGDACESGDWYTNETGYAKFVRHIRSSDYKSCPAWMTEYGDLDQTGEIEFEFAWRSTRRLLKFLDDGFSAGLVWDAFDNFHEHDAAWATYGLFKTDRKNWTYSPKHRYYAAKQVYRYVRPGFVKVEIKPEFVDTADVYAQWHAPLRNLRLAGFVSPGGSDFTIVGMSRIEDDIRLNIRLKGLNVDGNTVGYYRTSRHENCKKIEDANVKNNVVSVIVPERSIFTLTTVK